MSAPIKPSATIIVAPAECYTIRNGWAWAHIFVRYGVGELQDGSPRGWVNISVISDYGSFGYCWSHIGAEPWQDFLTDLDLHYAMNKMLGERFRVPMAIDEAEAKGRQMILQYRREDSLTAREARELWEALDVADRDGDLSTFLRDWDAHSGGIWYAKDWWDACWDKVNPQAEGFWREIWPHFIAAITSEDGSQPLSTVGEVQGLEETENTTEQKATLKAGREG